MPDLFAGFVKVPVDCISLTELDVNHKRHEAGEDDDELHNYSRGVPVGKTDEQKPSTTLQTLASAAEVNSRKESE